MLAFALAEFTLRLLYQEVRQDLGPVGQAVADPLFDAWIESLRPG